MKQGEKNSDKNDKFYLGLQNIHKKESRYSDFGWVWAVLTNIMRWLNS